MTPIRSRFGRIQEIYTTEGSGVWLVSDREFKWRKCRVNYMKWK
jgi:hypothetical protein